MNSPALSKIECSALRGIAILMIMLYNYDRHLIPIDGNEMKFTAEHTALFCQHWFNPLYIVSFIGWTGVCIFLFLSGYGLSLKYCNNQVLGGKELWSFYKHHLIKIAWLSLPLMALYSILNSWVTGKLGITLPGPYWFFPLILECYLVFPLLVRLNTKALILVILSGIAINTFCLYYPLGETTLWYIMRHHIFAWYATFATGIVIARHDKTGTKWYHILLPVALCASYVVKPLTPLTDVLTALTFCAYSGIFRNRILIWVGKISSSLFLLHAFVRLFMYERIDCDKLIIPSTILFLLVTFTLSWLHHRYMPENKPVRRITLSRGQVLYVLMMLVFCIPAFTRVLLHQAGIMYLVLSIVLCIPLVYALRQIRSKIIFCILFFCLMMLSGTEMFFVVGQKSMIQTAHIPAIITSPHAESSHFLDNNMMYMACTLPQLICGIAAMVIRCILPSRKCGSWKRCAAAWLAVLFSAALGAWLQITPYNIIKCCALAARQGYYKYRMIPMAEGMTFNATRPDTDGREYYVMCVGESLRASNMGINGYRRPTTPLLQAMDNLVSFPDFYSTATLTMYSVPMMITRATVDDYNTNYKEYGILQPYKECGFKTIVISPGKLLTYEKYLTRGADTVYNVRKDAVIPDLVDSLTQVYPKIFFLIQLYQSHCYFANFTPQYDVYHPNLVSDKECAGKDLLVNAYDNTVLYTDYIMSSIIHAIDKPDTRSTFLFASDHGEVLDMDKPRRGGVLNPGKEEYNVGMLFWSSDKWNQAHRDAARRIRSIRQEPVNADCLFYTACDMADITIDSVYRKPEWSLLSPQFKPHERKIMLPDGFSLLRPDKKW